MSSDLGTKHHSADVTPNRKRRPSARQARLAVAEARQQNALRAATLPESARVYIREVYQPLPPIRDEWAHLKRAVEDTLAASTVRGEDSMRKHVTHLAHFFTWARQTGLPLTPACLTRANLAAYEVEALSQLGRSTRQNRRSRLARMADQIHPEQAPIKGPQMSHRHVAAPYTAAEMTVIRRVAQVQPTPLLKRQMCLLVGLGAGAGIDSTDIKRLQGKDVTDHGADGIEVRVTNLRRSRDNSSTAHQRTVWVLREFEELVRIGIHGVKPNQLLLGRDAERANVAGSVFERAALHGDVPDLTQGRLRSTWMTTHLSRPTPLQVLLKAAGLTTARTLVELLPYSSAAVNAPEALR